MSLLVKIKRGEGPFYGGLKRFVKRVLQFHIPANGWLKPCFRGLYALHVAIREGLGWLARFFWYEPLFRSQCEFVGDRFQMEQLPYLIGKGRIVLGSKVRLSGKPSIGFSNRVHPNPCLLVGDNVFIGHGCGFSIGQSVEIGNNVLLATSVRVMDMDGHPLDAEQRRAGEPTPAYGIRPIKILDDAWIGSHASILKGVTVGRRSIVAAYSVVTRDVPDDVVVAGNPARVVKELSAQSNPHESNEI